MPRSLLRGLLLQQSRLLYQAEELGAGADAIGLVERRVHQHRRTWRGTPGRARGKGASALERVTGGPRRPGEDERAAAGLHGQGWWNIRRLIESFGIIDGELAIV